MSSLMDELLGSPQQTEPATVESLTVGDAEREASRPDDPADDLGLAGGSTAAPAEETAVVSLTGAEQSQAAPGGRRRQIQYGDNVFAQVRDVPVSLTNQLRSTAHAAADKLDRLWIEKISVSKLVTAFLAVNLGVRASDADADDHTTKLMGIFAGLDVAGEAMERRMEDLGKSLRQLRKDQLDDRRRARAVERGVAVLVAERVAPSRELLEISAGSVNRPSHVAMERILRAEAVSLAESDKRAAGVRMG